MKGDDQMDGSLLLAIVISIVVSIIMTVYLESNVSFPLSSIFISALLMIGAGVTAWGFSVWLGNTLTTTGAYFGWGVAAVFLFAIPSYFICVFALRSEVPEWMVLFPVVLVPFLGTVLSSTLLAGGVYRILGGNTLWSGIAAVVVWGVVLASDGVLNLLTLIRVEKQPAE